MEENKNENRILTELPRYTEGNHKGRINYQAMVNMEFELLYKGSVYKVKVLEYIKGSNNSRFVVEYNGQTHNIRCSHFVNGKFGGVLRLVTKDFKVNIGDVFKDDKRDMIIIDRKYEQRLHINGKSIINEKYYKYKCNKCNWTEGWIVEGDLLTKGQGCSCCANKTIMSEINSIWNTHQWLCSDFGLNENFAKTHSIGTTEYAEFTCIHCGRVKKVLPGSVQRYKSIGCSCGDGTSYPEKFMTSVLDQLNIEYIFQLAKTTFDWCEDKRYDFYIPSLNTIIETHGGQHYEDCSWSKAKDVQENDRIKYELALENGVKNEDYIVIDCRYSNKEWVKNNILSSKLNKLFDLEKRINWNECEEFALKSNKVKEVCEYWNNRQGETFVTLAKLFGLSKRTIREYLKRGTVLNWCNYNPKKGNKGKSVAMYDLNENFMAIYPSVAELARRVFKEMGIELKPSHVSAVCLGKLKHHKGYTFKYID